MWNPPTQKQLAKIPALNETRSIPLPDKKIHQHFFMGGCDWYIAEYGPAEDIAWGFVILNGDHQNSEWGYISLAELRKVRKGFVEVDREISWKPCKASTIKNIKC